MEKNYPLGFSIVLCTYNGASRLAPTLKHLAALQVPEGFIAELIVVDNASTDDTSIFASITWQRLGEPYQLRVLNENRPGKGHAVETGYDAARYSYILTVDDDNWLGSDYLQVSTDLLEHHPEVGVLQGKNEGVFETTPPSWFHEYKSFLVVGSPVGTPGYFPENDFYVWGAGMVIRKADWQHLRSLGFSFLTSKVAGKAAGEDHETAIALLLLGRKIYFSDKLTYKHYMPAHRVSWDNMKKGFGIWAFLEYYYSLYALVIDAYEKGYDANDTQVLMKLPKHIKCRILNHTLKQHVAYFVKPIEDLYQLCIYRDYTFFCWFFKLSRNATRDMNILKSWMLPILKNNSNNFKMSQYV